MPAEITKIEVKISCKECGTSFRADGVHKTGGHQDQYSASSWNYVEVILRIVILIIDQLCITLQNTIKRYWNTKFTYHNFGVGLH